MAASIAVVEMPARRSGPGARSTLRAERMRRVRLAAALRRGRDVDQHAAALDLHRKSRNAIFLEARLAVPAAAMEFPVMPRADDVPSPSSLPSPRGPPARLQAFDSSPPLSRRARHARRRRSSPCNWRNGVRCKLPRGAHIDPVVLRCHAILPVSQPDRGVVPLGGYFTMVVVDGTPEGFGKSPRRPISPAATARERAHSQ